MMRLERALQRHFTMALGVGVAVLALNLVLYFTAVSRLDRFAKTVKAQVAANRTRLTALEAEDKSATAAVGMIKNDRQVVDDLANKIFLTKGQRLVEVQNLIQGLADSRRLQSTGLNYGYGLLPEGKVTWGRRYLKVDVGTSLSGTYGDLKAFMEDLEKSPQFLVLESFNMNAGGQGAATVQGAFQISTYFIATAADEKELAGRRR
jgi:hypothetical protein